MTMSEKSKAHVDSCRFCWMCHHICPIGNATGHERSTPRGRALGISLVNRGAIGLEEIMDNIYECAGCGACVHDCVTGWDPVMFTKETKLAAALEGRLPDYVMKLLENCLTVGNAYGKTAICETLAEAISRHSAKTDTLLYLGVDARYMVCKQALGAIQVLEKAGVAFTVLAEEKPSGAQLDFLIGAANETKEQMTACADQLGSFARAIIYDPADAKVIKQTYKVYGVEVDTEVSTYTSFLAELLRSGKLVPTQSGKTVVYQDPFQLSRDLEETEEARTVISAFATLHEMHLNRAETIWAGNLLMAQYLPDVISAVAERRIGNAVSLDESVIVTACVSEYAALKSVKQDRVEILSVEDLLLGAWG